jgi:hypothetical protein
MVQKLVSGLLLAALPAVHGAFYNAPDEVPSFDDIDYIVVGGMFDREYSFRPVLTSYHSWYRWQRSC